MMKYAVSLLVIIGAAMVVVMLTSQPVNKDEKVPVRTGSHDTTSAESGIINDDMVVEIEATVRAAMDEARKKYGKKYWDKAPEIANAIYGEYGVTQKAVKEYLNQVHGESKERYEELMQRVHKWTREKLEDKYGK
jgi:hypothetical protein